MSELKRCPFCGGEVELFPTGLIHWRFGIRHKTKTECIAGAAGFVLHYDKKTAIDLWNRRADDEDN